MTPAQAIEVLIGALGPGLLLGGLSFLLFFAVLRAGFIHAVLGNRMAWSVKIFPLLIGGFLVLGVAPSVWPVSGLAEFAGAAILVGVPLAVLVMTVIPAARLLAASRAEDTISITVWCAALAFPFFGAGFALSVAV